MSSRKEELLSRLRNTLAIVSQATRFDSVAHEENRSQTVVNKTSVANAADYTSFEQSTNSFFSSFQSHKNPATGTVNFQSYGDKRPFDFDHGGGADESQWNVRTSSVSAQGNPVFGRAIPSVGNIESVEDEDEFLYGSSSGSQEPTRTSDANALFSYLPKGSPEPNIKNAVYSSSARYLQQASGQEIENESKYTGINSDVLQNVLRMVTRQSPNVHSKDRLSMDQAVTDTASSHNWTLGNERGNVISKEENLRASSALSQSVASVQSPSAFWTDLKASTSLICGRTESKEMAGCPVKPTDRIVDPAFEETSTLNSTVDKILQTINLDGDLRRLMEEKFKKENEKTAKDEEEKKQRLALEKLRMEEEEKVVKETEEHKKQLLEEQNRLLAEKLIQNLLKVKGSKEGLLHQATSVLDLFAENVEEDSKDTSSTLRGDNLPPDHLSAKNELNSAGDMLSDKKKHPISTIQSSNQPSKSDVTETRLIVTSGNLLKPEIDMTKSISKSRSNVDSAWEQSTEEFLRKLQSKEENKMEEKRGRTSVEESGIFRLSRSRSRGDSRSNRLPEVKSHCSSGAADESESNINDRKSSERNIGKVIEKNNSRRSLSPVLMKNSFPGFSHGTQASLTVVRDPPKIDTAKEAEAALTRVPENNADKTKEEMKTDIEALQAELANLRKIHSELVGKEQQDAGQTQVGKALAGTAKVAGTEISAASSLEKTVVSCTIASDSVLTAEQVMKLKVNQMEMIANIHALQKELENLQRLGTGLLQRPASHQRNLMIDENKRMQEEVQDQLWALRRATKELVEQLLLEDKNREHQALNLTPTTSVSNSALSLSSGSKAVVSNDSGSAPVIVDANVSVSATTARPDLSANAGADAKIPASDVQKLLASKPNVSKIEEKSTAKKTKKSLQKKSSSRSSSSSSSSSSSDSSSSSSSSSNGSSSRSQSGDRGRKEGKETGTSKDTKKKLGHVNTRKSRGRSDSRGKSRSKERSRSRDRWSQGNKWPYYRNRNFGYRNAARPNWHSRRRSRSSERARYDKIKSRRYEKSRSPSNRRERKTRSRSSSLTSKKSKPFKKNDQVVEVNNLKTTDKNSEMGDSLSKKSNELELKLKPAVERETERMIGIAGNAEELIKNPDNKLNLLGTQNEDRSLDEKKRCALELAISMYHRAEDYYDGGNTWCRKCDLVFSDIFSLCHHLHSDHHQLVLNPNYNKPKESAGPKLPSQTTGIPSAPARGDEFLMPLQAFFCSLCCEFSKDDIHAENHIKSAAHNNKFKQFLKENPSYEFQYLMSKMNAMLRSSESTNIGESMKRSNSREANQESEVKRIKITPFTQETKQPLSQNTAEKMQIKMMSGSLNTAMSPSLIKSEEKRVVVCDRKVSASQSTALHRNPSPPGPMSGAKAVVKPSSVDSSGLHFKRQINQSAVKDRTYDAISKLQDRTGFDIWGSPSKPNTWSSGDVTKSTELPAESEKKFENRPSSLSKKFSVDSPGPALKFQLNKDKKNSMGRGQSVKSSDAGKPSFNFKDFEVFDECD